MLEVAETLFLLWALGMVGFMLLCLFLVFFIKLMPKEKKPVRSYIIEDDGFEEWR